MEKPWFVTPALPLWSENGTPQFLSDVVVQAIPVFTNIAAFVVEFLLAPPGAGSMLTHRKSAAQSVECLRRSCKALYLAVEAFKFSPAELEKMEYVRDPVDILLPSPTLDDIRRRARDTSLLLARFHGNLPAMRDWMAVRNLELDRNTRIAGRVLSFDFQSTAPVMRRLDCCGTPAHLHFQMQREEQLYREAYNLCADPDEQHWSWAAGNHVSVREGQDKVEAAIRDDVELSKSIPFLEEARHLILGFLHCPFGTVPKKGTGEVRLITDASFVAPARDKVKRTVAVPPLTTGVKTPEGCE